MVGCNYCSDADKERFSRDELGLGPRVLDDYSVAEPSTLGHECLIFAINQRTSEVSMSLHPVNAQNHVGSMNRHSKLAVAVILVMTPGCATTSAAPATGATVASTDAKGEALRLAMRKLWSDHVVWTRNYIIAAVADDPSASAAAARLMKNQEDIGNAVVPFYGAPAGAKLTDLLKQHISIAVDLVAAAKAGDNPKVADADKRWHDNAADIATFLSGANPNWPRATLLTMLNEHLSLTTQEATARIQKKWTDDVAAFDSIYTQAMHMADALSDGIIKQHPDKV